MRQTLIIALVGLAGFKVWSNDHLFRSGTEDALLVAYRDRAAEVCANEGRRKGTSGVQPKSWKEARIVIGSERVPVYLWDMGNPLWDVRYRHPHILMNSGSDGIVCRYNLIAGTGQLSRT